MQTYRFDTRVSENGIISLPYNMPNLYGREVELFIVVPQEEKPKKTENTQAQAFVARWAGFLKEENINLGNAKYEYLAEKYQ